MLAYVCVVAQPHPGELSFLSQVWPGEFTASFRQAAFDRGTGSQLTFANGSKCHESSRFVLADSPLRILTPVEILSGESPNLRPDILIGCPQNDTVYAGCVVSSKIQARGLGGRFRRPAWSRVCRSRPRCSGWHSVHRRRG